MLSKCAVARTLAFSDALTSLVELDIKIDRAVVVELSVFVKCSVTVEFSDACCLDSVVASPSSAFTFCMLLVRASKERKLSLASKLASMRSSLLLTLSLGVALLLLFSIEDVDEVDEDERDEVIITLEPGDAGDASIFGAGVVVLSVARVSVDDDDDVDNDDDVRSFVI